MGPTEEALALADFLIADFGPSLDRHSLAYAIMEHEEAAYIAQQPPAEAQEQGGGEAQPFCRECGTRSTRHNPITVDLCARCAQRGTTPAPIGWVFQHDETGRMTFCENDGINTPDVFARLNPRHTLCGPAFTAPPSAPVGVEEPLSLLRAGNWREVYVGHRCMRLEVTYEHAAWERLMEQVEAALAQQPAAELYRCTACDDHYRIGTPCDCKLQPGHPDFTPATQQPASDPRSTHRVWRGDDWLPCYCEATDDHRIGSEQPASVGVPVGAVREYLDARACYEAATRPPNSHARAPVLKHDDPDARRLREARVALDNAIITSLSAPQPPAEAQPVGVEALRDLRDRVIPAALRHHASGNGYIEEAQEIVNRALAQQPAADPLEEWANRPLNFTATVGKFEDDAVVQQPSAAPALPLPGDRGSVQSLFNPQPPAEAQDGGEVELRHMVAKLAAHVRPTCGELWAEAEGDALSNARSVARNALRDHDQEASECPDCLNDGCACSKCNPHPGDQQPAAVDGAMACRLDDYLGGEFDIRIGKQAAHAALHFALDLQQGGRSDD